MRVDVNGEPLDIAEGLSVADVLRELGHTDDGVAVALNTEFVPRRNYAATLIKAGDAIEVVAPIQGG